MNEAAETRVHLDIALRRGYLTPAAHHDLDRRYDHLIGQLVRMADNPESWTIGRSPTSPTSRKRASKRSTRNTRPPGSVPPSTTNRDDA